MSDTYRSEVGAIFDGRIIYGANVTDDTPDELAAFYIRVQGWCNKHGIVLGEGTLRVEPIKCDEIPQNISYTLKAPMIVGPDFLIERHSD
jgi:hypothetical protein